MRNYKGEITVFLSLMLTILLSVLFTVIETARNNAVEFQTECAVDMAMQSALAEYNKEALEQYDLLLTDIGYGTGEGGYILLEQHLKGYLEDNLAIRDTLLTDRITDLLQISVGSVAVTEATGMADGNGMVLERKAVDYMLNHYGMEDFSAFLSISSTVEQEGFLEHAMEEKRLENEQKIDQVDTTVTDEEGNRHRVPINNPADAVNSRRGSSTILKLITGKKGISEQEADLKTCISHRDVGQRDGWLQNKEKLSPAEELLFHKYLMRKCGTYVTEKENSHLRYQMEYILAGKNSDRENLRIVTERVIMLRETANFLYLLSDSGKKAEAEALAMTLSAVILFPELKDLIKVSILIGWAYAESVNDCKVLLEGGKVPLLKSSADWKISLKNAMKLELEDSGTGSEKGLSYEDYLHILLAVSDKGTRNMRFMDLMEMDIRQTPGNEEFCLDHCIHAFTADITTYSAKGHGCMITRTAGYEK